MVSENQNGKISRLTASGEFWTRDGAIALEKKRLEQTLFYNPVSALSAASSTFYAASGNAASKVRRNPLWIFRAIWCLIWARIYSNRTVRELGGGIGNLTPAELDIRASICRKCTRIFWPGSRKEAMACIKMGLGHRTITPESEALLTIQLAELESVDRARELYERAFRLIRQVSLMTEVRIMRSHARFVYQRGNVAWAIGELERAKNIAYANNLLDQLTKINAQLRSYHKS